MALRNNEMSSKGSADLRRMVEWDEWKSWHGKYIDAMVSELDEVKRLHDRQYAQMKASLEKDVDEYIANKRAGRAATVTSKLPVTQEQFAAYKAEAGVLMHSIEKPYKGTLYYPPLSRLFIRDFFEGNPKAPNGKVEQTAWFNAISQRQITYFEQMLASVKEDKRLSSSEKKAIKDLAEQQIVLEKQTKEVFLPYVLHTSLMMVKSADRDMALKIAIESQNMGRFLPEIPKGEELDQFLIAASYKDQYEAYAQKVSKFVENVKTPPVWMSEELFDCYHEINQQVLQGRGKLLEVAKRRLAQGVAIEKQLKSKSLSSAAREYLEILFRHHERGEFFSPTHFENNDNWKKYLDYAEAMKWPLVATGDYCTFTNLLLKRIASIDARRNQLIVKEAIAQTEALFAFIKEKMTFLTLKEGANRFDVNNQREANGFLVTTQKKELCQQYMKMRSSFEGAIANLNTLKAEKPNLMPNLLLSIQSTQLRAAILKATFTDLDERKIKVIKMHQEKKEVSVSSVAIFTQPKQYASVSGQNADRVSTIAPGKVMG